MGLSWHVGSVLTVRVFLGCRYPSLGVLTKLILALTFVGCIGQIIIIDVALAGREAMLLLALPVLGVCKCGQMWCANKRVVHAILTQTQICMSLRRVCMNLFVCDCSCVYWCIYLCMDIHIHGILMAFI